jgi:hypothetical protein
MSIFEKDNYPNQILRIEMEIILQYLQVKNIGYDKEISNT